MLTSEIREAILGDSEPLAQAVAKMALPKAVPDVAYDISLNVIGELVTELTDQRKWQMQRLVYEQGLYGKDDTWLQDQIKLLVPLDSRRANAVDNYRRTLIAKKVPKGKADKMTRAYADKMLTDRAKTIADTESQRLIHESRRLLWAEQMRTGELRKTDRRKWITHPDERRCKICQGMSGKTSTITGMYPKTRMVGPPAHPNCRCWEILIRDKSG